MSGAETMGLRERTRRAVRRELADLALGMFVERGYEATTVEDIAAAAGLSKRSFFRYFPAKEDVLFGDVEDVAGQIAEQVRARPGGEDAWACLHAVLREWEPRIHTAQRDLDALRLIETTPPLRARLHQKRDELRALVAAALRERPGSGLDAFTADLLTSAAGAVLDAATREWLRTDGTADRAALIDRAFAALSPAASPAAPKPVPEPRRFRLDAALNVLPALDDHGFRNPAPDDVPALGELMWHAYRGTPDQDDAGPDTAAAIKEIGLTFEGDHGRFLPSASFVADDGEGRPVAASLVTLWQGVPLLAYVFTSPSHLGQGLARRLVTASMHALAAEGHELLSLAVTEDNVRARRLYEAMGFAPHDPNR